MSQNNQPQAPQQPQGQGTGPAYPAYPAYPGYPYYGYYPWYHTPAPVVLPPTPAERPARPGRARLANVILAVVALTVTVGALALAAAAPTLVSVTPAPGSLGMSQVYNQPLHDDPSHWDVGQGCVFDQSGLHATLQNSATLCAFLPSAQNDLTSHGFYLTTTVGPAAAVSGEQEPCIVLRGNDGVYSLAFNQAGEYELAVSPIQMCTLQNATGALPEAVAWHTDGYTPNVISLHYVVDSNQMVVYVNGQETTSIDMSSAGSQKISLGATGGGEAVFTSFALYSGS